MFVEIHNNIFCDTQLISGEIPICHCISSDYELGKGIAAEINRRYNVKPSLMYWGTHKYPDCLMVNNVINIVTKDRYWNKPTYMTFKDGLELTATLCLENGIKTVCMPRIGSGLDKIDWSLCREHIINILCEKGINVKCYYL